LLILTTGFASVVVVDRIRATPSLIEARLKSGKSESESESDIVSGLMLTLLTEDDTVNEECEVEKLSFLETNVVEGFS
jgi:hypothetical protein